MMFGADLTANAVALLDLCRSRGLKLATAESCTGGLIAGLLTSIAGSSDVVDRGFVTYSNAAKTEMIGVPAELIAHRGAVSREVAIAMAGGALAHSAADIAIAVTGVKGVDSLGKGSIEQGITGVQLGAADQVTSLHNARNWLCLLYTSPSPRD